MRVICLTSVVLECSPTPLSRIGEDAELCGSLLEIPIFGELTCAAYVTLSLIDCISLIKDVWDGITQPCEYQCASGGALPGQAAAEAKYER